MSLSIIVPTCNLLCYVAPVTLLDVLHHNGCEAITLCSKNHEATECRLLSSKNYVNLMLIFCKTLAFSRGGIENSIEFQLSGETLMEFAVLLYSLCQSTFHPQFCFEGKPKHHSSFVWGRPWLRRSQTLACCEKWSCGKMKECCYSAAIPSVAREIRTGPKTITNWPYWRCNYNTIALWVDYQHEATLGTIPWCSKISSDHLIHLIPRLHILVHSGSASSSGSPAFRLTQLKRYQLYKVSILIWTNL